MLLLIDNFDSFTFNIAHAIQKLRFEVCVRRNNAITLEQCQELDPDYLLIGPGHGSPKQSGISSRLIDAFKGKIPILGVCLGMQLIAEMFGGMVIRAPNGPMHGKTSRIYHNNQGIFQGLSQGFEATRYHSLIVQRDCLPNSLEITAETDSGEIMGLKHKQFSIEGVQFHPESILTTEGKKLFENFLASLEEVPSREKISIFETENGIEDAFNPLRVGQGVDHFFCKKAIFSPKGLFQGRLSGRP